VELDGVEEELGGVEIEEISESPPYGESKPDPEPEAIGDSSDGSSGGRVACRVGTLAGGGSRAGEQGWLEAAAEPGEPHHAWA
jgi:hypothetical protein